jgi:hypothetical protein
MSTSVLSNSCDESASSERVPGTAKDLMHGTGGRWKCYKAALSGCHKHGLMYHCALTEQAASNQVLPGGERQVAGGPPCWSRG